MKIQTIKLENVRGFIMDDPLTLSKTINILIGENNTGKSTILNSLWCLQEQKLDKGDVTNRRKSGTITYRPEGNHESYIDVQNYPEIVFELGDERPKLINRGGKLEQFVGIPKTRNGKNLIIPFSSKRQVINFSDDVSKASVHSLTGDLHNLVAKVDRLAGDQYKIGKDFRKDCEDILGLRIATAPTGNGKTIVNSINSNEGIEIKRLGDGVANILGLICELYEAEDKIFLIDQPEDAIHPKALKKLLDIIGEKAKNNQFFIATHSNIVMRHLGSVKDTKIWEINRDKTNDRQPELPLSNIREIKEKEDLARVLRDLGYEFTDFGLWEAWLFLEEQSAETFIRDYFIDWFCQDLKGKLQTYSCPHGVKDLPIKFKSFVELFVFFHLEPIYKNKVWVIADAGEDEKKIIEDLKKTFVEKKDEKDAWNAENFSNWSQHDFEEYYPEKFKQKFLTEIKNSPDKKTDKRVKKLALLNEVIEWIGQDENVAKEEFRKSAADVIEKLQEIQKLIIGNKA